MGAEGTLAWCDRVHVRRRKEQQRSGERRGTMRLMHYCRGSTDTCNWEEEEFNKALDERQNTHRYVGGRKE